MDVDKILLGKLLGEIYRLQKHTKGMQCGATDERIYALLNGFESAIENEITCAGGVTKEQEKAVGAILSEVSHDTAMLSAFSGYYDIEHELVKAGVERPAAIRILTRLNIMGAFQNVLAKMDSGNSPADCRKFEPDENQQ